MKHLSEYKIFESVHTKVLYHGTTSKFDKFELKDKVSNPTYGGIIDNGLGIFFTDNTTMAKWFAGLIEFDPDKGKYVNTKTKGRVVEAEITLKNPFMIKGKDPENDDDGAQEYFDQIKSAGGPEKFRKALIKKGYDGIIVEECTTNYYEDGTYDIWVVFDPKDIDIVKK